MKQPTKAIICAAGLGTRFLPQTKEMPKEMLPVVDRPVIQIIVEQAVKAGVTDIILVTSNTKCAIEDHFDRNYSLESELIESGKDDKAKQIREVAELANFIYIRQKGTPKGNSRPILNARHLIDDDEPFFVFFADDFFRSDIAWPTQLKDAYNKTGKSAISLIEIDKKDSDKYGMVVIGDQVSDRIFEVKSLVEKPGPEKTPSNFASVGSYLFTPEAWKIFEKEKVGKNGEIGVADSIDELASTSGVCGCFIDGVWHDTGDQLKYMETVVDMALENPKYSQDFEKYLRNRLK